MTDFSIPIPDFAEKDIAEITVTLKGKKLKYEFRVEAFPWEDTNKNQLTNSLTKVLNLKKEIESYDKEWEVVQIFNPAKNDTHIHVLYKKKLKQTE